MVENREFIEEAACLDLRTFDCMACKLHHRHVEIAEFVRNDVSSCIQECSADENELEISFKGWLEVLTNEHFHF